MFHDRFSNPNKAMTYDSENMLCVTSGIDQCENGFLFRKVEGAVDGWRVGGSSRDFRAV